MSPFISNNVLPTGISVLVLIFQNTTQSSFRSTHLSSEYVYEHKRIYPKISSPTICRFRYYENLMIGVSLAYIMNCLPLPDDHLLRNQQCNQNSKFNTKSQGISNHYLDQIFSSYSWFERIAVKHKSLWHGSCNLLSYSILSMCNRKRHLLIKCLLYW